MTSEERKHILSMINDGKITAEEGYELIASLDADPEADELEQETFDNNEADQTEVLIGEVINDNPSAENDIDDATRARMERSKGWWDVVAGIGVLIVIFSAYGMFSIQEAYGTNFWFFTMLIPLFLGVLLLMFAFPSKNGKWLFVEVNSGGKDKLFVFCFPLSILRDILNFTEKFLPPAKGGVFGALMDAIESPDQQGSPVLINVNDGDDQVKIFVA